MLAVDLWHDHFVIPEKYIAQPPGKSERLPESIRKNALGGGGFFTPNEPKVIFEFSAADLGIESTETETYKVDFRPIQPPLSEDVVFAIRKRDLQSISEDSPNPPQAFGEWMTFFNPNRGTSDGVYIYFKRQADGKITELLKCTKQDAVGFACHPGDACPGGREICTETVTAFGAYSADYGLIESALIPHITEIKEKTKDLIFSFKKRRPYEETNP